MSHKDAKRLNAGTPSRTNRRRNTKVVAGKPLVRFVGRNTYAKRLSKGPANSRRVK